MYTFLTKFLEKGSNTPDQEIGPPRLCKRGCAPDDGVKSGALKMHDLKMTDKENYGSGKCKSGK